MQEVESRQNSLAFASFAIRLEAERNRNVLASSRYYDTRDFLPGIRSLMTLRLKFRREQEQKMVQMLAQMRSLLSR